MLEKHRHLLIKFRGEIVEDLLVDDVLPYLRSKFVLDSEDAEVIRKELTSRRQAEKLLDILSSKGYNTFDHFFTVLKEKYQHLAQLLSSDESSEDENGFNHVLSPAVRNVPWPRWIEHNKFAMLRNLSLSELNEFHLHQCRNKKLYRKLAPMAFPQKER